MGLGVPGTMWTWNFVNGNPSACAMKIATGSITGSSSYITGWVLDALLDEVLDTLHWIISKVLDPNIILLGLFDPIIYLEHPVHWIGGSSRASSSIQCPSS